RQLALHQPAQGNAAIGSADAVVVLAQVVEQELALGRLVFDHDDVGWIHGPNSCGGRPVVKMPEAGASDKVSIRCRDRRPRSLAPEITPLRRVFAEEPGMRRGMPSAALRFKASHHRDET